MKDSHLLETLVSREEIFDGCVLHVTRDTVRLPNGKNAVREVAWHGGAVAVLPLFEDGTVLMERQYRYAHSRVVFEIPAGKLDSPEEDHLEAAVRELREETGLSASSITDLGMIAPSVAVLSERIHLYLAEGLTSGETDLDEDEFLSLERVKLTELHRMVMEGKIEDSKTQIAVLKVMELLRLREGRTMTQLS